MPQNAVAVYGGRDWRFSLSRFLFAIWSFELPDASPQSIPSRSIAKVIVSALVGWTLSSSKSRLPTRIVAGRSSEVKH
jgi:hypothetical protein